MRSPTFLVWQQGVDTTAYELTDRLHDGRTARVTAEGIVAAHAIAEALSVDVTVAA